MSFSTLTLWRMGKKFDDIVCLNIVGLICIKVQKAGGLQTWINSSFKLLIKLIQNWTDWRLWTWWFVRLINSLKIYNNISIFIMDKKKIFTLLAQYSAYFFKLVCTTMVIDCWNNLVEDWKKLEVEPACLASRYDLQSSR